MKPGLQQKLFEKYPKIFRQKDLPMTQTAMCWGIECGDGWYWLIDNLCRAIQNYCDNNSKPQVEAIQVKEKWGSLRFYCNGDDVIFGMIDFAGYLSYSICEECGSIDDVKQTEDWIKTLCSKCMKELNKIPMSKENVE